MYGHDANDTIEKMSCNAPWVTPDGSVAWQCGAADPAGAPSAMGDEGSGGSLARKANSFAICRRLAVLVRVVRP